MKTLNLITVTVVLGLFTACYKSSEGDLSISDRDIVVTAHDEQYNFTNAQTFILPDSVVKITNDRTSSAGNTEGKFDQLILDMVRQNMLDLGYTEVTDPENQPADLALMVHTLEIDNYVVTNPYPFWGYWGWYPWYPDYGYGPGYGGYYPYPVIVDSYTTGSIFINMIDPKQKPTEKEMIPMIWLGAINGILSGNSVSLETRITEGIDQAFSQSPYLTNKQN